MFLVFCTIGRFCFSESWCEWESERKPDQSNDGFVGTCGNKESNSFDNEEADLDAEIDWNNSDKKIQKARCDSERYLEQALFM